MTSNNPEHGPSPKLHEVGEFTFEDKLENLLPGVEFRESPELREARLAVLEALARDDQDPDFIRTVWIEYADVREQDVDSKTPDGTSVSFRAQVQLASLIHRALIFYESQNWQRYVEELVEAEEFAFNVGLRQIVKAINDELDKFTRQG